MTILAGCTRSSTFDITQDPVIYKHWLLAKPKWQEVTLLLQHEYIDDIYRCFVGLPSCFSLTQVSSLLCLTVPSSLLATLFSSLGWITNMKFAFLVCPHNFIDFIYITNPIWKSEEQDHRWKIWSKHFNWSQLTNLKLKSDFNPPMTAKHLTTLNNQYLSITLSWPMLYLHLLNAFQPNQVQNVEFHRSKSNWRKQDENNILTK